MRAETASPISTSPVVTCAVRKPEDAIDPAKAIYNDEALTAGNAVAFIDSERM